MASNPVVVVHGIPNCDTVKKARAWLTAHGVDHRFHDVRRDGLPPERLARWAAAMTPQALLNRKGSTWRGLGDGERAEAAATESGLLALIGRHPTLLRRPVVEWPAGPTVGFDPAVFAERFSGL
jgi:arsenate reductase